MDRAQNPGNGHDPTVRLSVHAQDILEASGVGFSLVVRTVQEPERTTFEDDGTVHDIKRIPEFGDRFLRVVVNSETMTVVTLFFDRRLRGKR